MDLLGLFGTIFGFVKEGFGILEFIGRRRGLIFQLAGYNPVGAMSGSFGVIPHFNVPIRVTNRGEMNRSIVGLQVFEEGGRNWQLLECHAPSLGQLSLPINVAPSSALDFWIWAESPTTFPARPVIVARLRLEAYDHTGKRHRLWLTEGPTNV